MAGKGQGQGASQKGSPPGTAAAAVAASAQLPPTLPVEQVADVYSMHATQKLVVCEGGVIVTTDTSHVHIFSVLPLAHASEALARGQKAAAEAAVSPPDHLRDSSPEREGLGPLSGGKPGKHRSPPKARPSMANLIPWVSDLRSAVLKTQDSQLHRMWREGLGGAGSEGGAAAAAAAVAQDDADSQYLVGLEEEAGEGHEREWLLDGESEAGKEGEGHTQEMEEIEARIADLPFLDAWKHATERHMGRARVIVDDEL